MRLSILGAFLNYQVRYNDPIGDKFPRITLFKNEAQFIPESFLSHHKIGGAFIEQSFGAGSSLGEVIDIWHLDSALVDKVQVVL